MNILPSLYYITVLVTSSHFHVSWLTIQFFAQVRRANDFVLSAVHQAYDSEPGEYVVHVMLVRARVSIHVLPLIYL